VFARQGKQLENAALVKIAGDSGDTQQLVTADAVHTLLQSMLEDEAASKGSFAALLLSTILMFCCLTLLPF
jgi:hypothetical protein